MEQADLQEILKLLESEKASQHGGVYIYRHRYWLIGQMGAIEEIPKDASSLHPLGYSVTPLSSRQWEKWIDKYGVEKN